MRTVDIELSIEDSLILLCCSTNPQSETIATIEGLLAERLNWDYVYTIAGYHDIACIIYKTIDRCENKGLIPKHILEKLKKQYYRVAYKNLLYSNEYTILLKRFNEENIKIIPLKGIAFLKEVYPNIALRGLADIDILVERSFLTRAESIMEEMHYSREKTYFRFKEKHFHSTFFRKRDNTTVFVELHWDFDVSDTSFKIHIEDFWSRSEPVTTGELTYYRLTMEDSILFNSFHIIRDSFMSHTMSLKNFCDLAEMIKNCSHEINWRTIVERAEHYQIDRAVFLTLFLLEELFQISLPEDFLHEIKKRKLQDKMIHSVVTERIFLKQLDNYIPTRIIGAASERSSIEKIKRIFKISTHIITSFQNHYYMSDSIVQAGARTFCELGQSLLNYIRLLYRVLFNYKKTREVIRRRIEAEKEQREIDAWICSLFPS